MTKILFTIFGLFIFLINAKPSLADSRVVSSSAEIKKDFFNSRIDSRVIRLQKFFEKYNSPLAPYSFDFVFYADKYEMDWRLVPAISGVESTFGKNIPKNSYNAYGWANGAYSFNSWEESIETVTKTLKEKYYDRGATNIYAVGRRYAPPSKTWAWKVNYFMAKIDSTPVEFDY